MALLNYDVLKKSGYDGYILEDAPVKVLQFGEGNFLRAFVDYWFDLANEKAGWNGKCCLVQPIAPGLAKMIKPVIHKCTKEISLAKLKDLYRGILQDISVIAGFLQNIII